MKNVEGSLREWGNFHIKHIDHADEYGDNILVGFAEYGFTEKAGAVKVDFDGASLGRDTILCPDMPEHLRKVERAVRRLSDIEQKCLTLSYCIPLRSDGHPYTISQLSRILHINKGKFRSALKDAKRHLKVMKKT